MKDRTGNKLLEFCTADEVFLASLNVGLARLGPPALPRFLRILLFARGGARRVAESRTLGTYLGDGT